MGRPLLTEMTPRIAVLIALLMTCGLCGDRLAADGPVNPLAAKPAAAAQQGGVGMAILENDDGSLLVRALMPGGPAEKAGVEAGDIIKAVDGTAGDILQTSQRLHGAPGSTVKITVRRAGEVRDITVTRAAIDLPPVAPGGQNAPAPAPVNPLAAVPAAAVPKFLQVGSRLSWTGGNSTIAGSHLVADEHGWIEWNGARYRLEHSHGSGGMGHTQVNILHADAKLLVADVRLFLLADDRGTCVVKGRHLLVGNADALGDYWVHPARLAKLAEGRADGDTVTRGAYALGDRQFKSISIRHQGRDGYSSKTYDTDTGLMLFGGTTDVDPSVMITHQNNGTVDNVEGNKQFSHNQFAAVRDVKIPWAAGRAPRELARGAQLDYRGGVRLLSEAAGLPPLPARASTVSYAVDDELAPDCVAVTSLARFDLGPGVPPNEVKATQAFGSAMLCGLWAPPDALRALQPRQVLDEDPLTRYRVIFGGVQGNNALVVEQGPTDLLEQTYDLTSGLLVATRYTSRADPAVPPTQVQYQLAGQK